MPGVPTPEITRPAPPLDPRERRQLGWLLIGSSLALLALIAVAVVTEHSARTPLIRVGQPAPDFALPSTDGGLQSLAALRGRPVLLAFVPSVICDFCRAQLRALQAALPDLRARGVAVLAISTDTSATQRAADNRLELDFPLLSEAPVAGQHPVGSAYGVYHLQPQPHPGPVDANAIVVVDPAGVVRAVRAEPGRSIAPPEILALLDTALGPTGGGR